MTEKQLISKLQELKQIKPRKDWVFSVKMNILESNIPARKEVLQPASQWSFSSILGVIFQRKLAYAFAVLLFVFVGVAGVLRYETLTVPDTTKVAIKSQADINAENTLKNQVADFKIKSQNLADTVKNNSESPAIAVKEVKVAATHVTNELQKNPELAKVIALEVNNNKSLLDIPGGNDVSEVTDMYKAIDSQLIEDLGTITLTKDQQDEFARIKGVYNSGKDYATVLRDILLLNASKDSRTN